MGADVGAQLGRGDSGQKARTREDDAAMTAKKLKRHAATTIWAPNEACVEFNFLPLVGNDVTFRGVSSWVF